MDNFDPRFSSPSHLPPHSHGIPVGNAQDGASLALTIATGLGVAMLVFGFSYESFWIGQHVNAIICIAICCGAGLMGLVAMSSPEDQARLEFRLTLGLTAATCLMVILPNFLTPDAARWTQPSYRGISRWRGWFLDPNNAGVILTLAIAAAAHLRSQASRESVVRHVLTLVLAVFCFHLAWTFSRTGWLLFGVLAGSHFTRRWQALPYVYRRSATLLMLGAVLTVPLWVAWGQTTDAPHLRRLSSFANTLDLSWGNRVHTAGASLQAILDKPWTGWGWDAIGTAMELLYKPAFLSRASAFWLNDYARIGAALGVPALGLCLAMICWVLTHRVGSIAWQWTLCLAVAMFFQGVVSYPVTHALLCIGAALTFGSAPPWRRDSWIGWRIPWLVCFIAAGFGCIWFLCPWSHVGFRIDLTPEQLTITPKGGTPPASILIRSRGSPILLGPMARAIAAKGLRAIVTTESSAARMHVEAGSAFWTIGETPGPNIIPADLVSQRDQGLNGTVAAQHVIQSAHLPATPHSDRPGPLHNILLGLLILGFLIVAAAGSSCWPVGAWCVCTFLGAASMLAAAAHMEATPETENERYAAWAAQTRTLRYPESVRKEWVLNPSIAPGFTLRQRGEVWSTFHQVTVGHDTLAMAGAVRKAIALQFTVVDGDRARRDFPELWRSRLCTHREACYLYAAALRAVNIPARIDAGAVRVWTAGSWVPVLRLPEAPPTASRPP